VRDFVDQDEGAGRTDVGVGVGRERLLHRLEKTRLKGAIDRFSLFLEKHGKWAIAFSFFFPGVRWAMPYVVGANRYPFMQYALFA
jgi:membrane protein DedA with SNARE-associated domain